MDVTIGGINIKYPRKGAPVVISGEGTFEGLELFDLYSHLRAIYNDRNSFRVRNEEQAVLRKIQLPPGKEDERL